MVIITMSRLKPSTPPAANSNLAPDKNSQATSSLFKPFQALSSPFKPPAACSTYVSPEILNQVQDDDVGKPSTVIRYPFTA
jgi:hypothetical protein